MTLYSFPPISNAEAKVLLLGTMPSVQSLQLQQYYGNPQNQFWKIVFTISKQTFSTDYDERKKLLLKNNIALWDVLQACEREGSLDSAIVKEVPNDFAAFLKEHPHISKIYCNGQQAAKYFKKYAALNSHYTLVVLPSTSPANAGMTFEQKLAQWQQISAR